MSTRQNSKAAETEGVPEGVPLTDAEKAAAAILAEIGEAAAAEALAAAEAAEAAENQAAGLAAAAAGHRYVRAASKAERAAAPAVEATWKALQQAHRDAPVWGPAPGIRLPSASETLSGTKEKPATVERREAALVRAGMPEAARVKFIAVLVKYHESLAAAGLLVSKADAVPLNWDDEPEPEATTVVVDHGDGAGLTAAEADAVKADAVAAAG